MRLWLGLVTALVLLLCITSGESGNEKSKRALSGDHEVLTPCPENKVCIAFSDYVCQVNGKYPAPVPGKEQGFVWVNKEKIECNKRNGADVFGLYARLDIEPLSLHNWKINAMLLKIFENKQEGIPRTEYKIDQFRFNFDEKSELTFSEKGGKFEWNHDGNKVRASDSSVEEGVPFASYDWNIFKTHHEVHFNQFTFEIALNDEKILDYIGPVVELEFNGHHVMLNDTQFPEKLSELTQCDVSEIKEVCYDSCDKIFSDSDSNSDSNSTHSTPEHAKSPAPGIRETNCPSTLWFHSPSEAGMSRKWKKVDGQLKCHMGWFQGNTTSGTQNIKPSMEVQCSAAEPPSMTSLAKIVIGVSAGVGGLVIVVLIVVVCVLMKRRRNHEMGGNTGKNFTLRDSDSKSKAQTPVGMTKSTEREKN